MKGQELLEFHAYQQVPELLSLCLYCDIKAVNPQISPLPPPSSTLGFNSWPGPWFDGVSVMLLLAQLVLPWEPLARADAPFWGQTKLPQEAVTAQNPK